MLTISRPGPRSNSESLTVLTLEITSAAINAVLTKESRHKCQYALVGVYVVAKRFSPVSLCECCGERQPCPWQDEWPGCVIVM
jgi:hypothetical protein